MQFGYASQDVRHFELGIDRWLRFADMPLCLHEQSSGFLNSMQLVGRSIDLSINRWCIRWSVDWQNQFQGGAMTLATFELR